MIGRQPAVRGSVADAILDAADRLIQRFGYSKTTVDDIAREACIGKGTIYLHFQSKEDVALSCLERLHRRLQERLWDIARGRGPAVERLRRVLEARVLQRFDLSHGYKPSLDDLYRALEQPLIELKQRNQEAEAEILAEVLTEGRLEGSLEVPEALPMARTLVLATNALIPGSRAPDWFSDRRRVEDALRRLIALLIRGLAAPGRTEPDTGSICSNRTIERNESEVTGK